MYPVNYSFVSYKSFTIGNAEGEAENITVLVLDEAANDSYWKIIGCFSALIKELDLKGADDATAWHISSSFASQTAFRDLVKDLLPPFTSLQPTDDPVPFLRDIYGIPVSFVEDERPFCVLELKDGKMVENQLWK